MTHSSTSGQSAAHGKVMMGYTLNKDTEGVLKAL